MAQGGYVRFPQEDFAAGAVRSVARHLIPPNGAYDILNGLVIDDGSVAKRGGCSNKSNAAFGASLRSAWDGIMVPGQRTLVASPAAFGVLDADDETVVSIGAGGLASPRRPVLLPDGLLVVGSTFYGGSRKSADYSTGTVAVTLGSKAVVGTGTAWAANVDPGMILVVAGGNFFVVESVTDNTHLTLHVPFSEATASGAAYTLTRTRDAGTWDAYATLADRWIKALGGQVEFSEGRDPDGNFRLQSVPTTNVHTLPLGAQVIAMDVVRDQLLVFTTEGLFEISNMALDLIDASGNPQHRVQHVSGDLIAWGDPGVAGWSNALVVPTIDGVSLVDGVSRPVELARSIQPLYRDYVRAGYKPGGAAVYRNHYVLPILDSSDVVVDLLFCRLDRPVQTDRGTYFAWSRFDGQAGDVAAVTTRVNATAPRKPVLLGAGRDSARLLDLSPAFEPDAAHKQDADGSDFTFALTTRAQETGPGNKNHVRILVVRYELIDAGSDDPMLRAFWSVGDENPDLPSWDEVDWDEFDWADPELAEFVLLSGDAPEDSGRDPWSWYMAVRTPFIWARLEQADPCARLVIRGVDWYVRPSAKQT